MVLQIKYKDDDGQIRETSLDDIIAEIGFEYSIADNVIKLKSHKGIIEIKIDGIVVWVVS